MANTRQAKKRVRQALTRRTRNVSKRSALRTSIKKVIKAIAAGEKENAAGAFKSAVPIMDKMVNRGIVPQNKVARQKSRLNAQIRGM